MIVYYVFLGIGLCYVFMLFFIRQGIKKVPIFNDADIKPKYKFSIIIPFRNEANNLNALIHSLDNINYPTSFFEVIFIDDFSEDNSVEIIQDYHWRNPINFKVLTSLNSEGSPKKRALELGISKAEYDWILTTDADCIVPEFWLKNLNGFVDNNQPDMIIMPVLLKKEKAMNLELIETLSLQLVTLGTFGLGKPVMSNGANFAFQKSAFITLNGYSGNSQIASGDDMFLLEKFLKSGLKVNYLKSTEVIVLTTPQNSIKDFIEQRIRWASKTGASNNMLLKFIGIVVLALNLSIVVALLLTMFQQVSIICIAMLYIMKTVADLSLVERGYKFFSIKQLVPQIMFGNLYYPFLNIYIAIRSMFGGFTWKDRNFKR